MKILVEEFAKENSSEIPDMRQQKKGIRYRHHYLSSLFEYFKFANPGIEISYPTFSSYWPKNIIKPRPGDYQTCKCQKCENPSLKLHALKTHRLFTEDLEVESVLRDIKMGDLSSEEELKNAIETLLVGPKSSVQVKYLVWEKVQAKGVNPNTGLPNRATVQRVAKHAAAKDLALEFLTDYKLLKEHLDRNDAIKKYVKDKRDEVLDSDNKVMLHVDWAENGSVLLPNEVQSAYYGGRMNYSIHSGYQYSKQNSGGFVSLSNENNHKAESVHCALDPKIKQLVNQGYKEFFIVSDSTTSQYRNGKSIYLTSQWSKQYDIKITWIYTEAGHGKSSADGIGGLIKNKVSEKVTMCPDTVINTVEDVKNNIETSVEIFIHTKENIQKIKDSMPKVGQLNGATRVHEVVFEKDGKMMMKNIPTGSVFKPIRLKIGREIERNRGETDNLTDNR